MASRPSSTQETWRTICRSCCVGPRTAATEPRPCGAPIPKQDGTSRALGLPTFEDKVLQRAVAMLLGAVYEQDFLNCSYGFRPGRSAHDALKALRNTWMEMRGGWVLEVDIAKLYDSLDHEQLRNVLSRRVRDGVVTRLIGKWLNAGVLEEGSITHPEAGTPQVGVISPLLANVFLHDAIDTWFERDIKPRLRGRAELVRYADDSAPRRRGKEALMAA